MVRAAYVKNSEEPLFLFKNIHKKKFCILLDIDTELQFPGDLCRTKSRYKMIVYPYGPTLENLS